MRNVDRLLVAYGESHQNSTNKMIHWICVPLILFSIVGLMMAIPWVLDVKSWWSNWAGVVALIAVLYYLRLSWRLTVGFILVMFCFLQFNMAIYRWLDFQTSLFVYFNLGVFILAWIGQFIGHKIEGKKPSFLQDLQFLLIGPAWLMHFIFKKAGIEY